MTNEPAAGKRPPRLIASRANAVRALDDGTDVFFAAVAKTRMPMTVTDPRQADNPIVFVNDAFIDVCGYSRDEIVGRNCRFLQGDETDPATLDQIRAAVAEHREITVELLNYHKNGNHFWNELYISPVFDRHNQLIYFFGSQLDVTRRREAEDALRPALAEKERLLAATRDFSHRLELLAGASLAITAAAALPETVDVITQHARIVVGAHHAVTRLTSDDAASEGGELDGELDAALRGGHRALRLTGVQMQAKPTWHQADEADPVARPRGWLAAPLVARDGRKLGVVQVSHKVDAGDFSAADEAILVQLAQFASVAVEKAQGDAARRESEARFRLLVDTIEDVFWLFEPRERALVYASPAYERLWGRTADELFDDAARTLDAIHPDDRERVRSSFSDALSGKRLDLEYRIIRPDGSERWVRNRGFPAGGGDSSGGLIAGVASDITDRKAAELALAVAERQFRTLAEAMPQLVWSTAPDGTATYCNHRWCAYTGKDATGGDWIERVYHEDELATAESWRAALDTGGDFEAEFRLCSGDGSCRWFLGRAVAIHDAHGGVRRWMGTCTDISDIVAARETLAHSRLQLEALVQERTAALIDANDRLKAEISERERAQDALRQAQKMEAVGQLTGGVAHDFNNLLTVILGNLESAGRRLGPKPDAAVERALANATQGAQRAATLTQRLLAFSRRQPLDPKPIDVNRLLAQVSELVRRLLGETMSLETVLAGGLWPVEADQNQLEAAILNLAVNARDAMPEGGKLTLETANMHLDASYAALNADVAPGDYVAIVVTDSGSGMSREVAARAFEPFFTTKDVGHGTGLGLSQVYGFVKQSGGHVKLYSDHGQGTTVRVYLPRLLASLPAEEPAGQLTADVQRASEDATVLVVEDEDAVRAHSVETIRELGYQVLEAPDGPTALRVLDRNADIRLLFTDVGLPGMDGRQLADEARRRRPELKVVFTTGYAQRAIVHHGKLDPGVQMIAKPYGFATLAVKLREVLEQPTRRVLIVEDEALVRMVAVDALRSLGLEVDEVGTAADALTRVGSTCYDAIVLDVGLPDRTGAELLPDLQAARPGIPVVITTGYRETDLANRVPRGGPVHFLDKPYPTDRLVRVLRELRVVS